MVGSKSMKKPVYSAKNTQIWPIFTDLLQPLSPQMLLLAQRAQGDQHKATWRSTRTTPSFIPGSNCSRGVLTGVGATHGVTPNDWYMQCSLCELCFWMHACRHPPNSTHAGSWAAHTQHSYKRVPFHRCVSGSPPHFP
jgi:hypothetical protein